MTISIVVAVAGNNVIGFNGEMPWHLQSELNYFKCLTVSKPVIMGRITYESIVNRLKKPLPKRSNIIVSNNANYKPPYSNDSVVLTSSIDEAINHAKSINQDKLQDEIMVIGGAQIYQQALPLATKVYRTRVELEPEGDAWFSLTEDEWKIIDSVAKSEGDIHYQCQQLIRCK